MRKLHKNIGKRSVFLILFIQGKTFNRTLYIHEYKGASVSLPCSFQTNQSKIINWHDFDMQYELINFRQVIFSDASTSGFKSELLIRSWLHAFFAIFNDFLKSVDAESHEQRDGQVGNGHFFPTWASLSQWGIKKFWHNICGKYQDNNFQKIFFF